MTTRSIEAGGQTLTALCDDALARQADTVLALFKRLGDEGRQLRDGFRVQYGWSLLTLRARDGRLAVCEPDFSGDPLAGEQEDITITLRVLVEQSAVVQRLGVEPLDAYFNHRVVIRRGVLDEPRLYLERKEPTTKDDTGWYIGPVESPDDEGEEYESTYVYHLLGTRPQLLRVLTLPRGYLVVFDGDEIDAVLNPAEEDVWGAGGE